MDFIAWRYKAESNMIAMSRHLLVAVVIATTAIQYASCFHLPISKTAQSFKLPDQSRIVSFSSNAKTTHLQMTSSSSPSSNEISRRSMMNKSFFISPLLLSFSSMATNPDQAIAAEESSVTSEQFETLLKDSFRSIQIVEFSGTKSENCRVRLLDGTTFTISDLVESPTDPRSPLKLQALCRGYNVPIKNVGLESVLANTPKRKKVYMNSRVQEAAAKEAAKKERMRLDEEERMRALYLMEQEEAIRLQKLEAKKNEASQ